MCLTWELLSPPEFPLFSSDHTNRVRKLTSNPGASSQKRAHSHRGTRCPGSAVRVAVNGWTGSANSKFRFFPSPERTRGVGRPMLVSALDLTLPEPPGASGSRIVAYRAMTVVLFGRSLVSHGISLREKKKPSVWRAWGPLHCTSRPLVMLPVTSYYRSPMQARGPIAQRGLLHPSPEPSHIYCSVSLRSTISLLGSLPLHTPPGMPSRPSAVAISLWHAN